MKIMVAIIVQMMLMSSSLMMVRAFSLTSSPRIVAFSASASASASASTRMRMRMRMRMRTTSLFSTSTPVENKNEIDVDNNDNNNNNEIIPMTLLSGFLGSGKTSALKHLLENTDGVRLGIIVNDVASVNIDAKLVSSQTNNMIQLENGCACCSLADELLTSVQNIIHTNNQTKYDAIVIELSGVADPITIKNNWEDAKFMGHPVTRQADVRRVITLVDACTFGTDWMTFDTAGQRDDWSSEVGQGEALDHHAAQRKIPELLAEQVEAANLILINKADLAGPDQVRVASTLARGINEKAVVETTEYGKVSPQKLLGELVYKTETQEEESHHHADTDTDTDTDTDCTHKSHSHDHDHHATDCSEPDCTHESHSHDHDHHATDCSDPACADETHSHDHQTTDSCSDPDCTDTTHSHSHSHAHSTSTDQLGITNFVYKRSKPFNTHRLMKLLNQWPVPIKDDLDIELLQEAQQEGYNMKDGTRKRKSRRNTSPFLGVLRSKGFVWLAPKKWLGANSDEFRHETAMYWSHAGKHFGLSSAGKWWATIPSKEQMRTYFPNEQEYNRVINEDFVSEEFGDRRQEIVFIGTGISEEEITAALDRCLMNDDEEMDRYRSQLANIQMIIQNTPGKKSAGLFGANTEYLE